MLEENVLGSEHFELFGGLLMPYSPNPDLMSDQNM